MWATLSIAFGAILARPATWPLALLTFLLRGGLLFVAAPILVLPSAVGLANVVVPWLSALVFGGLTGPIVLGITGTGLAIGTWIIAGGWLAAAAEVEAIRLIADEEEVGGSSDSVAGGRTWRIMVVRWLASIPLLIGATYALARLITIAYAELTVPSSVELPVAVRVAAAAPDALVIVGVTWAVGGLVGGFAARHLVLRGSGIGGAVRASLAYVLRHPMRSLVAFGVPLVAQVGALVIGMLAAAAAWVLVRSSLADGGALAAVLAVLVLAAAWGIGLGLLAVAGAWRAAALTVEVARTFGGMSEGQAGDWPRSTPSATMADLRPRGVDPDPR